LDADAVAVIPHTFVLRLVEGIMPSRCKPSRAFTIIELLVVVGVLVVLMGILIPAVASMREDARIAICTSGVRQWGLAESSYIIDWSQRLPWEGSFGTVSRHKNGVAVSVNGNTEGDAWYNALPPYVNAPQYGQIYDGTATLTALGQADNGYKNAWIWYCPTRILQKKNSGTNKNSAQYAMNSLINGSSGSGSGYDWTVLPNYGTKTNLWLEFNSVNCIGQPERTPFLVESDQNTASESPINVATLRHRGTSSNLLFLDNHVELLVATQVAIPTSNGSLFMSPSPLLIWGPWGK
jgi:prepilin-type processing-associated H-X9-DG protein